MDGVSDPPPTRPTSSEEFREQAEEALPFDTARAMALALLSIARELAAIRKLLGRR
ncbi:hypothetical protein SMICM304S_06792 [Streptomyces microflavus]